MSDIINTKVQDKLDKIINNPAYYPDGWSLDFAPLCNALEAKLYILQERGSSGQIKLDSQGKPEIYISTQDPPLRQRFTIAHEIGHFISYQAESYSKEPLAQKDGILERSFLAKMSSENLKCEQEANEIAAQLLMPEDKIKQAVARYGGANQPVAFYAELFLVSSQAMSIRLEKLGYWIF